MKSNLLTQIQGMPHYATRLQRNGTHLASSDVTIATKDHSVGETRKDSSATNSSAYAYIRVSSNRPLSVRFKLLCHQLQHNHETARESGHPNTAAATGRPLLTHGP